MTSRSTLSVFAGLAAVSAVLASLWASHGLRSGADRDRRPSSVAQSTPAGQSIRTVYPGPQSGPAQRITPPPQNEATAQTPPAAALALASSSPDLRSSPIEPTPPEQQSAGTSMSGSTTETAAAPPSGNQPASAGSGTDLNTASVEALNALGAGMIGRRIIAFRPYASPEDLVSRRVLKKADYELIKAAVSVR
jgi:hypothetical protein